MESEKVYEVTVLSLFYEPALCDIPSIPSSMPVHPNSYLPVRTGICEFCGSHSNWYEDDSFLGCSNV
jgi:hypothetical protein